MAYGRMVATKIGFNKSVNNLSNDTCRLAYTWVLPHLDRDGRVYGNPGILRAMIFPRREDVTNEMMQGFIIEWAIAELIQVYEKDGDWYLLFPKFRDNQKNIHYDREPESALPDLAECTLVVFQGQPSGTLPADCRKDAGTMPVEVKLREVKLRQVKGRRGTDVPPSEDLSLYHAAEESFLSRNDGKFTDYGKEGAALKGLVKKAKARVPDDPSGFLAQMISAFWKLRCGGEKFWQGQPFVPSALNASGVWDRVLETLRNDEKMADPTAMAIARGEIV